MPRAQSFDVPVDQMPKYVSAVVGLDRAWMVHGRCHPTNSPGDPKHRTRAWYPDDSSIPVIEQRLLQELALAHCRLCEVQHDCVAFAIESDTRFGIWAVDKEDRRCLSHHPRWKEVVGAAGDAGMSIHNVIVQLRGAGQIEPRKRHTASATK